MALDESLEFLVEEWLWNEGAAAVMKPAAHIRERRIEALFQSLDEASIAKRLSLALSGEPGGITGISFEEVADDAWLDRWRREFKPFRVGRFLFVGEWEDVPDRPDTLKIYPGQAFGTGRHETTRLMIRNMQRMEIEGKRVLDVGCGSGILSLVAERLGAASVEGFDNDPDCRENMLHHLAINQARRTRLHIGTLEDFDFGPFDVILANITLNVLYSLWPNLRVRLRRDGLLLCSGILAEQEEEARKGLTEAGFKLDLSQSEGEWILLTARCG